MKEEKAGSAALQVPWAGDRPSHTRKLRACECNGSASTSHCLLTCPGGGWGATQRVSVWNKWQLLFTSHGAFLSLELCSDLQGLVFKSTCICPLETEAYVQTLHVAHANSQWGTCANMVWQSWAGSAHKCMPAVSEISVRSLHPVWGSFTFPGHSLSLHTLS